MKMLMALPAAVLLLARDRAGAQSLEEETRRPPGSSSLHDDSDAMRGPASREGTNSLDNGSMDQRARPDQPATDASNGGATDGDDDAD